jgi:hypothetical protein
LNGAVKIDQEAIANLSATVRDYVVKSREEVQKTVTRFEWVKKEQKLNTAIRELEFALTQLSEKN